MTDNFVDIKYPISESGGKLQCPKCGYPDCVPVNRGRRAGTSMGLISGGSLGILAGLEGAEVGAVGGAVLGPIGIGIGFLGGAACGGILGHVVGDLFDKDVAGQFRCLKCKNKFHV